MLVRLHVLLFQEVETCILEIVILDERHARTELKKYETDILVSVAKFK